MLLNLTHTGPLNVLSCWWSHPFLLKSDWLYITFNGETVPKGSMHYRKTTTLPSFWKHRIKESFHLWSLVSSAWLLNCVFWVSDFTIAVTHPRCYYDLSTDQPEVHPISVYLAENTIVVKALFCGHPSVSSNKHSLYKTFGCLKTFNFTALSSEKQVLSAYRPSI